MLHPVPKSCDHHSPSTAETTRTMSINDTSTTIPPPAYTPRRTPSLETIERVLPTFFNCPATSVASELAPAPANTPGTIPVCPHESLTPARLASILSLPGLGSDPSDASKVLGALTPTPDAHHRRNMVRSRTKGSVKYEARVDCHPLGHTSDIRHDTSGNKLIAVKGFGKFLYDRPQPPKRRRFLRRGPVIEPSLVLHMTWELCVVPRARDRIFTLEEFCKEVEKAKVQLCAHKRLSDPEFTESMFEQFNPFGSLRDPILRHQTRQEGYNCK